MKQKIQRKSVGGKRVSVVKEEKLGPSSKAGSSRTRKHAQRAEAPAGLPSADPTRAAAKEGPAPKRKRKPGQPKLLQLERELAAARAEIKLRKLEHSAIEGDLFFLGRQIAQLRVQLAAALSARREAEENLTKAAIPTRTGPTHSSILSELEPIADANDLAIAPRIEATEQPVEGPEHDTVLSSAQPTLDSRHPRGSASATQVRIVLNKTRNRLASIRDRVDEQLTTANQAVKDQIKNKIAKPVKGWRTLLSRRRTPKTKVFDSRWIRRQLPELRSVSFKRYLTDPKLYGLDPHPLFDVSGYLDRNPDVRQAGISPFRHYLDHGWREGRNPHVFFANDWYLQSNPDVLSTGANPLEHYLEYGWKEGRWPNPVFDPRAYLSRYPDVEAAGIEPLTHYVMFGREERRDPVRGFGSEWRELTDEQSAECLMNYFLATPQRAVVPQLGQEPDIARSRRSSPLRLRDGSIWPPAPISNYSLPQLMRDVIVDGYGEEQVDLIQYLCSVMGAFSDRSEEFASSQECQQIMERLRELSAERLQEQGGEIRSSIVIPVYNNLIDTLLSITAILETKEVAAFEIIVADDCSNDATAVLVPSIGGVVRHLRQGRNLGFLGNCNAAANEVKGETIVLLNNDTLVLPGWLDALLFPFEHMGDVGLVGSKLISWDGSLQEAGGIFWNDGSAWNFGRGRDAREPQFNYLKDVDYCSGAAIAVPLDLWRQMGGFDPVYSPAYCEDADLAFRLREAGYRTLFNPQSEVIHHEGRSHGRDLESGTKAYQVTNQRTFVQRWHTTLQREHFANAQNVLLARDRSRGRPHLLVIDHYVPQWDRDAGSRTIHQYLGIFLELGCQITFWPDNLYCDPIYTPGLQALGVEVISGPEFRGQFERFMRERADLFDIVFISRPEVAIKYLPTIRKNSSAKILFYGHDLHFRRLEAARAAGITVGAEEIEETRKMEFDVCRNCDVVFYPDPEEIRIISKAVRGDGKFIANPVFVYEEAQIAAAKQRLRAVATTAHNHLLFVGSFNHAPNREGIIWFVNEVMQNVRSMVPDVRLEIVGSNPPPDVLSLASHEISVLGRVSDDELERLYNGTALVVAPLRFGAGVKGKVIEAMAFGVPVATTSIGAQGIKDAAKSLFVGDTAESLAKVIVDALTRRSEAEKRVRAGLDFIAQNYGRQALVDVFKDLIAPHASSSRRRG